MVIRLPTLFVVKMEFRYLSTSIVSSSDIERRYWMVEVTPNDGYQDGVPSQASILIENTPPVVSSVVISPSSPYNDDVLTCSANSFDPDETLS